MFLFANIPPSLSVMTLKTRSGPVFYDTRSRKKPRSSGDGSNDTIGFSNDVLHQIFGFFVSNRGLVDGPSLRAISLTCKQWKNISYSSSIWAIPAGFTDSAESMPITRSLRIRETARSGEFTYSQSSLLGFSKINRTNDKSNETNFRVLEHATGKKCILSIAKSEEKTPEMIKEIFEAHLCQGDDFLGPQAVAPASDLFPRGVCIRNGRVVRWYEDPDLYRIEKEIGIGEENLDLRDLASTLNRSGLGDKELTLKSISQQPKLRNSISHLLRLEDTIGSMSLSRPHIRMDRWVTMVDWILEIVECFDLDDKTAFQAMSFIDRFVASKKQPLKVCNHQRVAGACLLIASKCNALSINGSDIAFCADKSFNVNQIQATEDFIIRQLGWKLAFPTTIDFVEAYAATIALDNDSRTFMMMRYIAELALQSPIYLSHKPSMVAASVLLLARFCLENGELWPEALERETQYSLEDLRDCTEELSTLLEGIRLTIPDMMMISRRYRKASRQFVADVSIPSIASFAILITYQESFSGRQSNTTPSR